MSDVAKHATAVSHGVMPYPDPPILTDFADRLIPFHLDSATVFDGDDHNPFDPSFDIDGAAARVVTAYDRDGDGAIDLGTGGLDDVLRRRETSRFDGDDSSSIEKLAEFADENGNGDGSATVEEIANVIGQFDQGAEGDARLSGQERETFLAVFGEERLPRFRHVPQFPDFAEKTPYWSPKDILIGAHPMHDGVPAVDAPAGPPAPPVHEH